MENTLFKKTLIPVFIIAATAVTSTFSALAKTIRLTPDNVDAVVAAMTPEDKANLIVGMARDMSDELRADVGYTYHIVPGVAGTTCPITYMGVTPLVLADGPAGIRMDSRRKGDSKDYFCTRVPMGTLLSSTWNDSIVAAFGSIIGEECRDYGIDILLGPGMNIMRNPLCGRNFEYYSEDPLLSVKMAAAFTNGVQSHGVGVSLKHFAANNQEINRLANDSRVSQRALRELYLRNFEIAIRESEQWSVMSAYNYVNGEYASQSKTLLTDILRREWGFEGVVMSDWGAGISAVDMVKAGNDMIQPGINGNFEKIVNGQKDGTISSEEIDACVKRILEIIVRTHRFNGYKPSEKPDLEAHSQALASMTSEGLVLLKNESALPLAKGVRVALFGVGSYDFLPGGDGSGAVRCSHVVNLKEGLGSKGITLSERIDSVYECWIAGEQKRLAPMKTLRTWYQYDMRPLELPCPEVYTSYGAEEADVAVVTISRNSAEGFDRHLERDYMLHIDELALIHDVSEKFHARGKKVVVVLNVCGVVDVAPWRVLADAILLCWLPGQDGGTSVASVLAGEESPSGHLPVTFPMRYADVPSQNFPLNVPETGLNQSFEHFNAKRKYYDIPNIDYTDYDEDIYVGYRHYATRGIDVAYPFGFGLTYTDFELSDMKLDRKGDTVRVRIKVRNTGDFAAKQVVQVYATAPDNVPDRPKIELKGYAKTRLLQPGTAESVEIEFPVSDLAIWENGWNLKHGKWQIHAGTSSADLPLSASLEL